jgi:hypothetical protein
LDFIIIFGNFGEGVLLCVLKLLTLLVVGNIFVVNKPFVLLYVAGSEAKKDDFADFFFLDSLKGGGNRIGSGKSLLLFRLYIFLLGGGNNFGSGKFLLLFRLYIFLSGAGNSFGVL